ncbi:MAG: hypothetical protein WBW78_19185, partial [Terrimicrobiaceae bacterium]
TNGCLRTALGCKLNQVQHVFAHVGRTGSPGGSAPIESDRKIESIYRQASGKVSPSSNGTRRQESTLVGDLSDWLLTSP